MRQQFTGQLQMMPGWEAFGMQQAGKVADGVLGIALGAYNDQRQLKQQRKLQNLQMEGNKAMMDYSNDLQYDLWKKTNYSAQKEEMKKAGLNPALMYGMSGGGGTTTGSPSGGVSGAQAPSGGREIQDMMAMGIQYRMQEAQLEVLKSQANLNNAEAGNKGAIKENIQANTAATYQGIAQSKAEVEKLAQETDNEKAKWDLMRVDLALKRLQEYLANKTVDLDFKKLGVEIRLMEKHLEAAGIEVFIAGKTKWNVIEKARLDVVNAGLDAELKEWEKKIAPEKLRC